MYRRPATYEEGLSLLRDRLKNTQKFNTHEVYSIYWNAADFLINGTWAENMLIPLCKTSEITSFLFKTVCPVLEEVLCTPDAAKSNITKALEDENAPRYVEEVYTLIQNLLKSANLALTRADAGEDLKLCAKEILKIMDNKHVMEGLRLLSISNMPARICMRIGLPRMTQTFLHDKGLHNEEMNADIVKQFIF